MSHQEILLHADRLRVRIAPDVGGSIAAFTFQHDEHVYPVLRCVNGLLQTPLEAGCFPLVPYCNRIRDGHFIYEGRDIILAAHMTGARHALHGHGWLASWQILEATNVQAHLSYHHAPDSWPWAYEARQSFTLDEGGLSVRLECRNLSADPMPCGLGLHPYFPVTENSLLDVKLAAVWLVDEEILPTYKAALDAHTDPSSGPIMGRGLDNGYEGWDGSARILDPQWPFDLEMEAQGAEYFQIYAPENLPILVAEPVSHANAALNAPQNSWPALGVKLLAQGEAHMLGWRLHVRPKPISPFLHADKE